MPAAANIVLADHVPANHTFKPISQSGNAFLHETSEMTIGGAERTLILELSRQSSTRATDRVTVRLNVPFEQTVDGVTSVRSTARFIGEVVMPSDMTATERSLFAALVKNALAHATVQGYMTNREPVY